MTVYAMYEYLIGFGLFLYVANVLYTCFIFKEIFSSIYIAKLLTNSCKNMIKTLKTSSFGVGNIELEQSVRIVL